jgi:membrane-bound ClpP family serine protease
MALIITLIIVGLLLIIAELVLIPGIFITGLLGLCSLTASCYIAFTQYGQTAGIITIAINIILIVLFTIFALRSKTWKKISLSTNIDSKIDTNPLEKGLTVGMKGTTITRLNPMGKAKICDLILEVTTLEGLIAPNNMIEIVRIDDNKIYVKSIN